MEGYKELLMRKSYGFDKLSSLSALQTPAGVSCLVLVGRFQFRMPPGHGDVFGTNGGGKTEFGIVMKAPICAEMEEVPGWV